LTFSFPFVNITSIEIILFRELLAAFSKKTTAARATAAENLMNSRPSSETVDLNFNGDEKLNYYAKKQCFRGGIGGRKGLKIFGRKKLTLFLT